MFYFKRLMHCLFILTFIASLSACSPKPSIKTTQEVSNKTDQKIIPQKTPHNKTLIKAKQQLDELFTPAIGLF